MKFNLAELQCHDLQWLGFDLDDTLHYYQRAAQRAIQAVLAYLSKKFNIAILQLEYEYQLILKEVQAKHFIQTKTAREYRQDRFNRLLTRFAIVDTLNLNRAITIYEQTFCASLQLIPGAATLLKTAKKHNLKTVVISEGPHDAQLSILTQLNIAADVDVVITSSREQLSKSDGLFERTLKLIDCPPAKLLYVGNSLERDIYPALASDIKAILLLTTHENLPADITTIHCLNELTTSLFA